MLETLSCSELSRLREPQFHLLLPWPPKAPILPVADASVNLSLVLAISVRVIITARYGPHLFISAGPSCVGNMVLYRAK